jgi:hypothetical protein
VASDDPSRLRMTALIPFTALALGAASPWETTRGAGSGHSPQLREACVRKEKAAIHRPFDYCDDAAYASTAAMRRKRPLQSSPFGLGTQPSTAAVPREKRSLMQGAAIFWGWAAAVRTKPPFQRTASIPSSIYSIDSNHRAVRKHRKVHLPSQ